MTEFFTRSTWRAGGRSKLRKRMNAYGGCKVAPPAFLAAAKLAAIKPGRANRRLCSSIKRDGTPCRRLAMKGCKGCEAHGGILALARRGYAGLQTQSWILLLRLSLGSSERVLAPGAPKSGQRRADYVPVASAQKARQSEPRSTATRRNAMPAWQGKARFGRQGAA